MLCRRFQQIWWVIYFIAWVSISAPFVGRQGLSILLFSLRFSFCFLQQYVRRLRTSVPLRFCMLVLPDWSGMNIFPIFEMGAWVFESLCWPFLHTVSDFFYFQIFRVFSLKGQMGFNFKIFPKFGVFASFCVLPCFPRFSWHNVGRGPG